MSRLELRNASVARGGRTILQEVTFPLQSGDFIAMIGPNGSGKSTLLRALAGLWETSPSGAALLDGQELRDMPRSAVARRIAFVPQETLMGFSFTVLEVVRMGRYPHRGRFSRETDADRAAIARVLDTCDVAHLQHRAVDTLSGGERQRVLIARSLAGEPDFVLLDEPTASLDVEHSLQIHALCRSLAASGRGVMVTSHDLNSVARHSSGVALMHAGKLIAFGHEEDVLLPERLRDVFRVRAEKLQATDGSRHYVFHALSADEPRSSGGTAGLS